MVGSAFCVDLGGDQFLLGQRLGVKEGLHRRLAEAPSALVRAFLIVALDPAIEIDLQLGDRAIDRLAERHAIELVCFVEVLAGAVGLLAPRVVRV